MIVWKEQKTTVCFLNEIKLITWWFKFNKNVCQGRTYKCLGYEARIAAIWSATVALLGNNSVVNLGDDLRPRRQGSGMKSEQCCESQLHHLKLMFTQELATRIGRVVAWIFLFPLRWSRGVLHWYICDNVALRPCSLYNFFLPILFTGREWEGPCRSDTEERQS